MKCSFYTEKKGVIKWTEKVSLLSVHKSVTNLYLHQNMALFNYPQFIELQTIMTSHDLQVLCVDSPLLNCVREYEGASIYGESGNKRLKTVIFRTLGDNFATVHGPAKKNIFDIFGTKTVVVEGDLFDSVIFAMQKSTSVQNVFMMLKPGGDLPKALIKPLGQKLRNPIPYKQNWISEQNGQICLDIEETAEWMELVDLIQPKVVMANGVVCNSQRLDLIRQQVAEDERVKLMEKENKNENGDKDKENDIGTADLQQQTLKEEETLSEEDEKGPKEDQVETQKQQIIERDQQIEAVLKDRLEIENQLQTEKILVDEKQKMIETQKLELYDQQLANEQFKSEIEALRSKFDKESKVSQQELKEKQITIESLNVQLQQSQELTQQLNDDNTAEKIKVKSDLDEKLNQIKVLEEQTNKQQKQECKLNNDISEHMIRKALDEQFISQQQLLVNQLTESQTKLNDIIVQLNNEISQFSEQIQQKDSQVSELTSSNNTLHTQIMQQEKAASERIAYLESEIQHLTIKQVMHEQELDGKMKQITEFDQLDRHNDRTKRGELYELAKSISNDYEEQLNMLLKQLTEQQNDQYDQHQNQEQRLDTQDNDQLIAQLDPVDNDEMNQH